MFRSCRAMSWRIRDKRIFVFNETRGEKEMIRDKLLSQLVAKQTELFSYPSTPAQRENVLMQIDARKDELRKEGMS